MTPPLSHKKREARRRLVIAVSVVPHLVLPGATHRSSARRAGAPDSVEETSSIIFIFASVIAVRIEANNAVPVAVAKVTRLTLLPRLYDHRRGEPPVGLVAAQPG